MPASLSATAQKTLKGVLTTCFPEATCTNEQIEAFAYAIRKQQRAGSAALPGPLASVDLSSIDGDLDSLGTGIATDPAVRFNDDFRYYWVKATHTRFTPAGFPPFTGQLPMVRVSLPMSTPQTFETSIGTVEPNDHLIAKVSEANAKYSAALGYSLQRVDLITPPRSFFARFGAISVLLGYKKANAAPSCYILEAGMATGEPRVLYLGKTLNGTINSYAGYKPTPFACKTHAYKGSLTLSGDSPGHLSVRARKVIDGKSKPTYIDLAVDFEERTTSIKNVWPGFLLLEAAAIVLSRHLTHKISEKC